MLELFINKKKPYNHSNNVHKRWIVAKLLLENESLQYLAKTVICKQRWTINIETVNQ